MGIELPAYSASDERMLRSHLSLVHGTYVNDVRTAEGLVECHDSQHADPDPHFMLAHVHTEAPVAAEDVEEWEW